MNNHYLEEFKKFLAQELQPAMLELKELQDDKSRKHIQKLVFANLVDRLDFCIDKTFLCMLESDDRFLQEIMDKHNQPISESDMLKMILSENPKELVFSKLRDTLRSTALKERHSKKLCKLLQYFGKKENELKSHRVNPSTGHILTTFKKQNNTIPTSIIGYSDWIYSRRNAIVHGGGDNRLSDNDITQLKRCFNVDPAKSAKLSLASIKTTSIFYNDLLGLFN
jgi:hypothetical protein